MRAVRRERTGAGAGITAAVEAWPGVEVWPHRFGGWSSEWATGSSGICTATASPISRSLARFVTSSWPSGERSPDVIELVTAAEQGTALPRG